VVTRSTEFETKSVLAFVRQAKARHDDGTGREIRQFDYGPRAAVAPLPGDGAGDRQRIAADRVRRPEPQRTGHGIS
jgi:hypothetical protein